VHVDPAKYLLIRLCLRKPGKWHRLNSLKYQRELGEDIATALEILCTSPKQNENAIKQEELDIIDLTLDETQLQDTTKFPSVSRWPQKYVVEGPSSMKIEDTLEQPCGDLSFFAQDHTHAELPELLECLSSEELRQLEKDLKIKKASRNVSCVSTLALSPMMC
jgi:fanconi-associated nuclease 1